MLRLPTGGVALLLVLLNTLTTVGQTCNPRFSFPVRASADDARQNATGVSTNSDLLFAQRFLGVRFAQITIPKTAIITNAYIQFTTSATATVGISNVAIKGENVDNSIAFTAAGTSSEISTRYNTVPTSTSVTWNNPAATWTTVGESGVNQRSPDLTALVQEIINRPGWQTGNPITMLINASVPTTGPVAFAFDNGPPPSWSLPIPMQRLLN